MKRIHKGDEVVVTTGRSKGQRGHVLRFLGEDRLLVENVNMVKKHQKPNPMMGRQGGIVEKEAPLHVSNVALFNPENQKADRVGFRVNEDGTKVRVFKSTGKEVGA